jgi:hypothetical protein
MKPSALVLVAVAVGSAFPNPIAAQRPLREERSWRTAHVALASAFAVALEIDAAQTREAMRRGYREVNPLLGPRPSTGRVNTYTALAGLTVVGIAAVVPARLRRWVLGVALAVETVTIASTFREGIGIRLF